MIVRSITLQNFRSYRAETFTFHDSFNLISGDNAQGKTNLLEAIHFLCTSKPFKQVKTEELITFGESDVRIKGEIEVDSALNEVHVILSNSGKTLKLNGKVVYRAGMIAGRFNIVTFLPSDLDLIKGSPQVRRNYIDDLISSLDSRHVRDLKSYFRAVSQRNAILRAMENVKQDRLDIWDEKIGELGEKIIKRRLELKRKIEPLLMKIYGIITGLSSEIKIRYAPTFKIEGGIEEGLKKELRNKLNNDIKRGHTTVGPHRDDITFTIDGKDAAVFASQGESKTLALALRTSELELTENLLGKLPILLLDDITSELDEKRKSFLFRLLEDFGGQVFVTATTPNDVLYRKDKKIFEIKAGRVIGVS